MTQPINYWVDPLKRRSSGRGQTFALSLRFPILRTRRPAGIPPKIRYPANTARRDFDFSAQAHVIPREIALADCAVNRIRRVAQVRRGFVNGQPKSHIASSPRSLTRTIRPRNIGILSYLRSCSPTVAPL